MKELSKERKLNPKKFWNHVQTIIQKRSKGKIRITDTGDKHGSILTDPREIEAKF